MNAVGQAFRLLVMGGLLFAVGFAILKVFNGDVSAFFYWFWDALTGIINGISDFLANNELFRSIFKKPEV